MPFAKNGGVRLFWKQDGADSRPALLLLAPALADLSLWDRLVPFLTDHLRVIRMDTRGHGASDAPTGDYTLAELASDAWCVLDAAGVGRAFVYGQSLGSLTALQMAADRPERLEGIIVGGHSPSPQDGRRDRLAVAGDGKVQAALQPTLDGWIAPDRQELLSTWVDPLRHAMSATSETGIRGCAAALRDADIAGSFDKIAVPALSIDDHPAFPGGHLACLENPGALATGIGRFVDRLRPDGLGLDPARNGERVRREILGDAWVDRSIAARDEWIADYQDYVTEVAWHTLWGREGLDYRTRRLIVLALTAALGRWEEYRLHVRSGLERGSLTVQDVKEVALQAGLYAGVPVAHTAFAQCTEVFRAMGAETRDR